jgi:L-rhamnose isomerase/sugar isomerase
VFTNSQTDTIVSALDGLQVELPSWGFANTGTRFGKFLQPAAASSIDEKLNDAGHVHRWTGACPIDQSHHLKGKIEAMIQTVMTAQELYAKAALVDHGQLTALQQRCSLIDAENCLKAAFSCDVRPVIRECAAAKGLPTDPLEAFRQSGYLERITAERSAKNLALASTYA